MQETASNPHQWDELAHPRKQWEPFLQSFLAPISTAIIHALRLKDHNTVLDVATGTGEPGLTVASQLSGGQVTAVDISGAMLRIAEANARRKGISNFSTVCCDVVQMPFPHHCFDAVMCRNGVAFFPDLAAGLSEMFRVLKPGGRIAVSTWSLLEKNLWIKIVLDAVQEISGRKMYNSHVPGMFYGMQSGFMTDWFEETGFTAIEEQEITGIVAFDTVDEHWNFVTSVSAAVTNALQKVSPEVREAVRQHVRGKTQTHVINDRLYFQWTSRITTGTKPI